MVVVSYDVCLAQFQYLYCISIELVWYWDAICVELIWYWHWGCIGIVVVALARYWFVMGYSICGALEWYWYGTGVGMVSACYRYGAGMVLLWRLDCLRVGLA